MSLRSWLSIPRGSHFSLANIPFGIISTDASPKPRPAVAIGDYALDLEAFTAKNGFSACSIIQPHQTVFSQTTLNAFAALGRPIHSVVRKYIQSVFSENTPHSEILKSNTSLQREVLIPLKEVKTHLPMHIGDYTDFYAGRNHAFNVGSMFRGKDNALQPNYNHLPVGYHGRASSVVVSGTRIRRPQGQILENPVATPKQPIFSPCKKLDIELELGALVCKPNKLGEPITISAAEENIFGVVLMNDWSARDIQAWEYVPLGPFNAKNFGTTISPWIVLVDALEPFMTKGLSQETELLPYLREKRKENMYDIRLQVNLTPESGKTTTIATTSSKNLLFSFPQMLAHHSITGCPMNVGDLLGSGTISGLEPTERGALIEQTWNGKDPIRLEGGEERTFLEDGDTVTIKGVCGNNEDSLVGFGECVGTIEAAINLQPHIG
ncbi:Fumarylacetoacetase [Viridothelium virens]|uniref:Fumarylacetoacetase n=1 Tax=Viridothelium virens TaxID=1048519 RepID=A0A6A6H9Z7_VIRVR|nr:Fumarylacetoacetase [Viridothelium virens]